MKELIIKKEYINSDLTPGERDVLILIHTQNKLLFKHYSDTYEEYVPIALESLEKKLYIKVTGDEFEDLIVREKGEKLLQVKSIEKDVDEILTYLNTKLNKPRGFNLKSKGNRKFVSARLHEDYTKEDLIDVIDVKYDEWSGTSQEFYLRPETLFNSTKFASYIIQVDKVIESNININTDKV